MSIDVLRLGEDLDCEFRELQEKRKCCGSVRHVSPDRQELDMICVCLRIEDAIVTPISCVITTFDLLLPSAESLRSRHRLPWRGHSNSSRSRQTQGRGPSYLPYFTRLSSCSCLVAGGRSMWTGDEGRNERRTGSGPGITLPMVHNGGGREIVDGKVHVEKSSNHGSNWHWGFRSGLCFSPSSIACSNNPSILRSTSATALRVESCVLRASSQTRGGDSAEP